MAEYIERGGKLFPTPFSSEEHGDYRQGWNHCLRAIYQMPAADVVEVVRCRDCKYRAEDDFCTGRGWPDQLVADNGFCDKGKRKDGGQDDGH